MSLAQSIKRLLYKSLSLENYLKTLSWGFFAGFRLGVASQSPAYEYPHFLKRLVAKGDTVLDIGANLGYYSRILSRLVGSSGRVFAVEPVAPIMGVLRHNLRHCKNVEILPYALGEEEREIVMCNDTARYQGYFGTGQNFVGDAAATEGEQEGERFPAQMRRGSELFSKLTRLNFIKCDIEGYEVVVMNELRPLLERFRPTVLIETGGENRAKIIKLFHSLNYRGYTLEHGLEVPLTDDSEKDIIWRAF
mgnify:CR=1 FL=1